MDVTVNITMNLSHSCREQSRRQKNLSLTVSSTTQLGNLLDHCHFSPELTDLSSEFPGYYILCNGRRKDGTDYVEDGKLYHIVPRLLGGKGGFGSMLRAIGAQIEKTTSREACRDLSGRRMRDINNEKKLKEWLSKEADREKEKEDRRAERLARKLNPPQHRFEDQQYHDQKNKVQEDLQDALQTGLKRAHIKGQSSTEAESSQTKRAKTNGSRKEWLGVDVDSEDDSDLEADPGGEDVKHVSSDLGENTMSESSVQSGRLSPEQNGLSVTSEDAVKTETVGEEMHEGKIYSTQFDNCSGSDVKMEPSDGLQLPKKAGGCNVEEVSDTDTKPDLPKLPEGPINLEDYYSESSLCRLGLERLKTELMTRGLKCGGSLEERASRLWSVKGLHPDDFPSNLLAKAKGKGKKSK